MSMNFPSRPAATSPTPKKNNNKLIAEIIIVVVLGTIGAVGIIHEVQKQQNIIFSASEPGQGQQPTSNLEQNLFNKCQKLQDWYRSLDGLENTNYHCDQYAKAWSGLAK